jgi:hypothetical protein
MALGSAGVNTLRHETTDELSTTNVFALFVAAFPFASTGLFANVAIGVPVQSALGKSVKETVPSGAAPLAVDLPV